nr:hypothetical protein [Tanacetum cinerariifolium]
SDSNNDDDISSDDDDFEDIEYVEASLSNLEIVNQEEEEVDLEDISQIQDIVLCEKLLSITRLISNIESLNDNPTPDLLLNSSVSCPIFEDSDNFLSDNFSPEFETFCDHMEETRIGNTTHANDSLLEYDSFCFEIEPDQERLINVVKNDISDDSSNDPLLEEADLFLFDNSIPPGIENVANDSEGDIRDSNFEDNLSVPLPPPKPPDAETDAGEEIPVVMNDKDKFDEDYHFFMFDKVFSLLSAESEDTIFDSEEVDLFLFDDSIPSGIENDSPLIPRPPPEPPDDNFDLEPKDYPPMVEEFLCRIFSWFPRPSYPLIDFSLGKSISVIYIAYS